MRLYQWDGKALTEVGLLEGNRAIVSALGISPDGSRLAAGDVRIFKLSAESSLIRIH